MITSNLSAGTIGWVAIAAGIPGLLGFVFIILFFTMGQPFGTLNDICIGLTAILSAILAGMLFPWHRTLAPVLSWVALVFSLLGAVVVVLGSVLVVSGVQGWFLAGLYMAAGNALIGLWLLGLNYSALKNSPWPHDLVIFGLVAGFILALGLLAVPGIINGIQSMESAPWLVNAGQAGALGYLLLFPIWSLLLGWILLLVLPELNPGL